MMEAITEHTALTRELLKETVVAAGWLGTRSSGKNRPSYLRNLFHERLFGEGLFKGQAHQTASIVPLLQYYVQTVIQDSGRLPPEKILSFNYLSMCLVFLRKMTYSLHKLTLNEKKHLDNLQRLHMQAFTKAYGMQVKPKHHVRFHIPEQFLKIGFAFSCEVLESRHRSYKSGIGDRQCSTVADYSQFSSNVLVRLLRDNFVQLQKFGLPFWELKPPIQEASTDEKLTVAALSLQTSEGALAVLSSPSVFCSLRFACCMIMTTKAVCPLFLILFDSSVESAVCPLPSSSISQTCIHTLLRLLLDQRCHPEERYHHMAEQSRYCASLAPRP